MGKEDHNTPWFPNIIGMIMIVFDKGCILVVELFFLNVGTYFLEHYKDTLGNSFVTLQGWISVLLDR